MDTEYEPLASCPQFEAFLNRIMNSSTELIGYLQRAVGYSLTGHNREQCFFIAHGTGANGKSVFLNLIRKLMGSYALTTPMTSLVGVKHSSGASNDIARLRGARFVSASEGEANQKLRESLIKQLTGGDTISARFLFQEFFDFTPTFKLWMATNHKPQVSGADPATWRRIHLIPFNVVIPPAEQDGELLSKLENELPGVLNWAIEGSVDWYRNGLMPPPEVLAATEQYRSEMDGFSRFLDDGLVTERVGGWVSKADLYAVYNQWCVDEGLEALTKNDFGTRMNQRGYEEGRRNSVRYWRDVEITSDDEL
tara:strand:- start:392 stop:1318 length:927 start_codon:yes stop_codon:yes gene_type:complete